MTSVPWAFDPERHRLADATRALLDAIVRTGAPADELADVAGAIEAATARLTGTTFQRTIDISPESHRHEMALVNGRSHPFAPLVEMVEAADGYRAIVTLGSSWEGAPGLVHGGALSLLFDHVMAWAVTRVGEPGPSMTATMTLTYRRPTPIGVPLTITSRVDRAAGRKVHIAAELTVDGHVTVEGSALFVKLSEQHQREKYRLSG